MIILTIENGKVSDMFHIPDNVKYEIRDCQVQIPTSVLYDMMLCNNRKAKYFPSRVDITYLKNLLEEVFNIPKGKLCTKTRRENFSVARQTGMYILFRNGYGSLKQIGEIFNKDHATVLYAIRTIRNIRETKEKKWSNKIEECIIRYERKLYGNKNEKDTGKTCTAESVIPDAV